MNEVTEGIYGRPGGPGAEKLALENFWQNLWTGRIGVFTCKTFVGTFALKSIGHTCSCIFPFGVRATAGAMGGRGRRSHGSGAVERRGHGSRVDS